MTDSVTTKSAAAPNNWAIIALLLAVATVPPTLMWLWWSDAGKGRLAGLAQLLYWLMPMVCVFSGVCFVWRWRARESSVGSRWRTWWPGIVLAIVATAVVFVVSPPQMRVQFDETSLVGTSQNMHLQRMAVMTTGALPDSPEPQMLENTVDKRPTLFAFLVSVVHDVTGYRLENTFVVNGALLALGLFVLFAAVRSRLGVAVALSAPLLVLSVPLTVVVATSAGFELLATVLLLLTVVAALAFVERPGDGRFAALIGTAALLAHARYESVLAVALIGGLSFLMARGRYRLNVRAGALLAIVPTLVVPLLMLLEHAQAANFTPEAGGQQLVAFEHLTSHTPKFLAAWFGGGVTSALPGWLAVVAALLWGARLLSGKASSVDLFATVPIMLTVVVLAWFYGDVEEPTALRLFLPLAWASLLPLLAAPVVTRSDRGGRALLIAAAVLCATRLPFVATGTAFPELRIATLTRALDAVVERLPGDRATTLWVGVPAQHLIIKGQAALSVRSFMNRAATVSAMMRRGEVQKVYLIETPLDRAMAPAFGSPRDVLAQIPGKVVERVGGGMSITVHQLGQ